MRAGEAGQKADGAWRSTISLRSMSRLSKTLAAVVVLAVLAGCARAGASRTRSPSMTDPGSFSSSWVESPRYHAADP